MRKIIIEVNPSLFPKMIYDELFETTDSIKILELLRVDFEKGVKLGIMEVIMKEGYSIENVKFPAFVEIVNVLQSKGNNHTCLIKVQFSKEIKKIMKEFNLEIIWSTPMWITKDKAVISCIGENEDLIKFLNVIELGGEVKKVRYPKTAYGGHDILLCLTDKQREVLIAANKYGYYNHPRELNIDELSKILKLSKSTTGEHLRKAEARIISNILAGY